VLPAPFDPANGLLTPSLKLRRDAIVRHYAAEIDAMYQVRTRGAHRPALEESADWDDSDDVFR
jgi:long-chain acyl-CoA synthetase